MPFSASLLSFRERGRQTKLLTVAQHVPYIMTYNKLPNYLRKYRKQAGLSQREIAYLLGGHDAARVSRYEHFHGGPSLRIALAFSILFRVPTNRLFGGDYQKVEAVVNRRARILLARLATGKQDQSLIRKLAVLKSLSQPGALEGILEKII